MKQYIKISIVTLGMLVGIAAPGNTYGKGIYEIIKAVVVRVIKAIDLQVQKQQNKVVWLQNAQKVIENELSKLKLKEIADWTEKQKEQYRKYYEELRKVKALIAYYQRLTTISRKQSLIVKEYSRVWRLVAADRYFTQKEKIHMSKVYGGILQESAKNIDQLALVINSYRTQMTDGQRLEMINQVAERVEKNYSDLKRFNGENILLRLHRAKSKAEADHVKKLYGIN